MSVISKLDDYDIEATAEDLLTGIEDAEKYSHGKKITVNPRSCQKL